MGPRCLSVRLCCGRGGGRDNITSQIDHAPARSSPLAAVPARASTKSVCARHAQTAKPVLSITYIHISRTLLATVQRMSVHSLSNPYSCQSIRYPTQTRQSVYSPNQPGGSSWDKPSVGNNTSSCHSTRAKAFSFCDLSV